MRYLDIRDKVASALDPRGAGSGRIAPRSIFRAICCAPGSWPEAPATDLFREYVESNKVQRGLAARCTQEGALSVEIGVGYGGPLTLTADDLVKWAVQPGPLAVLLLDSFEMWEMERQISFLATLRGEREGSSPLVLVAAGRWKYQALRTEWARRSNAGTLGSHPFDACWNLDGMSADETLEAVRSWGGVHDPAEQAQLAEFVVRQTQGDSELFAILDDFVRQHAGISPHKLVADLPTCGAMVELVRARARGLSQRAAGVLEATLRFQFTRLDEGDPDAEDLSLRGLLRRCEGGGGCWQPASPVVGQALLSAWSPRNGSLFRHAMDLFPAQHPASREAYEQVGYIENLLRNVMTIALGWESNEEPADALAKLLPPTEREAAWRRDYADATDGAPLLRKPMAGYLELESLKDLTSDALYASVFKYIFPEKEALLTHLRRFGAVRRHVAHNRAVGPTVLQELGVVRTYIEQALASAGRRMGAEIELSAAILEIGPVQCVPIEREQSTKIITRIKNVSQVPLRMAKITIASPTGNQRAVSETLVTIGAGDSLQVTLRADGLLTKLWDGPLRISAIPGLGR